MLKNEKKYKKNPDTLINVFFGILSFDYFIVLPIYIFNHYTENKFCLALDDVIVLERVFINTEIKENVKKKNLSALCLRTSCKEQLSKLLLYTISHSCIK